ncbi:MULTISPECIES: EAL domain-containing protein [unclassified Methylophaga]|jgi:diguanylate cyclase (GGDEF)-like protein|uniref:EAL domain-containing protein n=3 Tax=Methylophaga TaxID=40222 RepID=UPI000C3B41EB|nr:MULTISPECIES: EAL domain-containing protein [unclassified Methylophaga]MAL50440.1 sensor domain-containing phosphodiesterase [Methylophaga sp.]MBP26000.1 sensor domain-containing phosphodiesterase [Methylophaga sp.]|tara:strand:+ start:2124 stop:4496 length:2373 start_codon:yes stop_codon:yes gene_type:complete
MLRSLLVDSSKKLILWMLFMLVILFIAGMWILSSLNLNYSEDTIGEVRQKQIEETFFSNLNKIVQTQSALERDTNGLARIGSLFADLFASESNSQVLNAELGMMLQDKLKDFEGTLAVGIWFDPEYVSLKGQPISRYVFRDKTNSIQVLTESSSRLLSIEQQQWFDLAGIAVKDKTKIEGNEIHWTPAYYNEITDSAVLTLIKPILNSQLQVVGYASTDWEAKQIIDLVSQVSITPNTFALLIDKNKRKLSSLSRLNNERYAQKIIDSVMSQDFIKLASNNAISQLKSQQQKALLQTHQFAVEDIEYVLYAATTPAQMLFAVGVPKNEIDAVIAPMRVINQRILIATSIVILLLSAYLVYRIALLMQELQASYTDQLTGLPNRARLLLDLQQHQNCTLILVNIDRFRELNSIFGNDCGDAVLQSLTTNIGAFCQDYNHADSAKLYRLSGDEFVLLGFDWSKEFLTGFLRQLSDFLQEQQLQWQDQDISITATLGAAGQHDADPDKDSSPDILISYATAALKIARDKSRHYAIYDSKQDVERIYEQNLFWARQLKQALQQNRIVPWFQPIMDNQSGEITKYECLIRMIDPDGQVISPGVFLPVASNLRLDSMLTRVMVEKSFQKFAELDYEFSINLSYRDLLDTELTQFIFDQLKTYQVGKRLIFEILESDGIDNYNEVRRFIDKAKGFGCKIAIDDFGTGYSNFEHLLRLNVDLIKIDGSLIRNLNDDQSAIIVTRGVVQFARSLGIKTVAEFVHCEAVQKQVQALDIDFSQGAYFSMPKAELVETPKMM